MKPLKITFLFNQIMTGSICTGGDIRGQIIAELFQKDGFNVEVVIPEICANSFPNFKKIIIGHNHFEKKVNKQTLLSAFILFSTRTIELIYQKSIIKTDILYATGDFFCNIIPSFIIKILKPKTKFIVSIHHINENPFIRKSNSFLANTISYLVQQFSLSLIKKKSDLIFVVNNQVKKNLIKKGFCQPIIVTENGLDTEKIEKLVNSIGTKPTNHISYFGRLSPTKGSMDLPIILSQVLKKYPNIHLDMVGIALPEIKKPLIQKFTQFGCSGHYTIHGFIENKDDIFKILSKSKVLLFPSYEEGWGISLFESIMTKRPVVTYNLPIFKEIFKGKLCTVPIGDTTEFSKKIINFIKKNKSISTQKYINNCYLIAKKFDWKNVYLQEKKSINNLFK